MRYCVLRFRADTFKNAAPETVVYLEQKNGSIKKYGPERGQDMEFAEWHAKVREKLNGAPGWDINDCTTGYLYWNRWNGEYEGEGMAIVDAALMDIMGNVDIYGKHSYSGT